MRKCASSTPPTGTSSPPITVMNPAKRSSHTADTAPSAVPTSPTVQTAARCGTAGITLRQASDDR